MKLKMKNINDHRVTTSEEMNLKNNEETEIYVPQAYRDFIDNGKIERVLEVHRMSINAFEECLHSFRREDCEGFFEAFDVYSKSVNLLDDLLAQVGALVS